MRDPPSCQTVLCEDDLVARLCRALETAETVVELFARDGYVDAEASHNSFDREKPIAETAMLLYASRAACRFASVASRWETVARRLIPQARSDQTLVKISLQPSRAVTLAFPHALLTRMGFADAAFDDCVKACLESVALNGRERPPVAALERLWIESLLGCRARGREWEDTLRGSVLGTPVDLVGGIREDHYAFTHLLMYCADLGQRRPSLPRPDATILSEAESQLARCLNAQDYDLVGELAMSWPLVRASWSPAATFCFRLLARIEDQVGVLPGGTTEAGRLARLQGRERIVYAFATGYHTVYVLGMLCGLSLRPGRLPPPEIVGPRMDDRIVDRLIRLHEQSQAVWLDEIGRSEEDEKRALGPLLLDLGLDHACRLHDYARVAGLLAEAASWGMEPSAYRIQAAELLDRLAHCSRLMASRRAGDAEVAG